MNQPQSFKETHVEVMDYEAPSQATVSDPNEPLPDATAGEEAPDTGSDQARRRAAVILEVLAGIVGPTEASQALGIGVQHYYQLERRALLGLVHGCEPQPKGPRGPGLEEQLAALQRELADCQRECLRQAALVRITQRALGLPTPPGSVVSSEDKPKKAIGKPVARSAGASTKPTRAVRRTRRPAVRALRALRALRRTDSSGPAQGGSLERTHGRATTASTQTEWRSAEAMSKEVTDGSASR